jgi:hypothetical protein
MLAGDKPGQPQLFSCGFFYSIDQKHSLKSITFIKLKVNRFLPVTSIFDQLHLFTSESKKYQRTAKYFIVAFSCKNLIFPGMRIYFFYTKPIWLLIFLILCPLFLFSQETNSHVSGKVKSEKNEILAGATVTAIHVPTQNTFITQTRNDGFFYFANLKPGGPYTITISYTGYEPLKKSSLYVNFNSSGYFLGLLENEPVDFILKEKSISLGLVTINAANQSETKNGAETSISNQYLTSMPSISRNLQDFVRLVPQSKVNGDGMMSLAGQNNKFNAFFIDGANNNDILGIALSGINGGQTGTPPISIDALEEIKVILAPYNVQYSNFTGGSINAITKSGSNTLKSSAWYLFRNEQMAGRSPLPVETSGTPGSFERPRLSDFFNQTQGVWLSGPLIRNKLFYFLLAEKQSELRPQPFNFSDYRGNSSLQQLNMLADTLRRKYNYEPGPFLETKEVLNATRTLIKLDWNPSVKNKFTLTYRYNFSERQAPQNVNSSTVLRFLNNGFIIPARTHTGSFEWKRFFKHDVNNRMLFTFTNELDDRRWIGQPFPAVSILDGNGTIFLGSNGPSQLNLFKATDLTLFDAFRFIKKHHNLTVGIDLNYTKLYDLNVTNYFGNYQFKNLNDFFSILPASRLQRNFSLLDKPVNDDSKAGANYKTLRQGFFINDEIQINSTLKLNIGLRLDGNAVLSSLNDDSFFNDTAYQLISKYYKLEDAKAGNAMKQSWQLSPRFGFTYKLPGENLIFRGGAGIFTGHILNVWISNFFNPAIGSIDINPQLFGLGFNPDPYNQPDFQSSGINAANSKGGLAIVSNKYKYPTIFRTSFSAEKKMAGNWAFTLETIFTKNIHETEYTNVNILPPSITSAAPDIRNIYSLNSSPNLIPLYSNGTNPYNSIILQSNNKRTKGFSYSLSATITKTIKDKFNFNASYTFGSSVALFEPTGTASPVGQQWRASETVNGKNFTGPSNSDFDYGHRVLIYFSKYVAYIKTKTATIFSMFYNGQSGSRFSYVYNGSIINDNGNKENFDLIYIPSKTDLNNMVFIPNTVNGVVYSAQQQKDLFNNYIENDKYLNKHRGKFAERNGARLPFTHTIDLRIQQDFKIKRKEKEIRFSITYDVFNFTNMLNKKWGRIYFLSFDNYPLVKFAGYANPATLIPQYQFSPFSGTPYSIQPSTAPGNSARWISQLGFRVALN